MSPQNKNVLLKSFIIYVALFFSRYVLFIRSISSGQRALGKVQAHLLQEIEDQRSLPGGFFDDATRRKIIDCGGPLIISLLFIAPPKV